MAKVQKNLDACVPMSVKVVDHNHGSFVSDDGKTINFNDALVVFGGREVIVRVMDGLDLDEAKGEQCSILVQIEPKRKVQSPVLTMVECNVE